MLIYKLINNSFSLFNYNEDYVRDLNSDFDLQISHVSIHEKLALYENLSDFQETKN